MKTKSCSDKRQSLVNANKCAQADDYFLPKNCSGIKKGIKQRDGKKLWFSKDGGNEKEQQQLSTSFSYFFLDSAQFLSLFSFSVLLPLRDLFRNTPASKNGSKKETTLKTKCSDDVVVR